eukprot:8626091-Alexandrium_andersonii.AAC.1
MARKGSSVGGSLGGRFGGPGMLVLWRGSAAAAGKSGSSRAAGSRLLLCLTGRGSNASESGEGCEAF